MLKHIVRERPWFWFGLAVVLLSIGLGGVIFGYRFFPEEPRTEAQSYSVEVPELAGLNLVTVSGGISFGADAKKKVFDGFTDHREPSLVAISQTRTAVWVYLAATERCLECRPGVEVTVFATKVLKGPRYRETITGVERAGESSVVIHTEKEFGDHPATLIAFVAVVAGVVVILYTTVFWR